MNKKLELIKTNIKDCYDMVISDLYDWYLEDNPNHNDVIINKEKPTEITFFMDDEKNLCVKDCFGNFKIEDFTLSEIYNLLY